MNKSCIPKRDKKIIENFILLDHIGIKFGHLNKQLYSSRYSSINVLWQPAEAVAIALAHHHGTHKHLDRTNIPQDHFALLKVDHEHQQLSDSLAFPVVWMRPRADFSSSSDTAPGASILLPRIKNGTLDNSSIDNNDYRQCQTKIIRGAPSCTRGWHLRPALLCFRRTSPCPVHQPRTRCQILPGNNLSTSDAPVSGHQGRTSWSAHSRWTAPQKSDATLVVKSLDGRSLACATGSSCRHCPGRETEFWHFC